MFTIVLYFGIANIASEDTLRQLFLRYNRIRSKFSPKLESGMNQNSR